MNNYNPIFKFAPGPGVIFTDLVSKSGYGKSNFVFIYKDEVWENYASKEDEAKLNQKGFALYSDKQKTEDLFRQIDELIPKITSKIRAFDKQDLSVFSKEKIKETLLEQAKLTDEYLNFYNLTEYYFFDSIEDKINLALEIKFSGKELTDSLTTLLSSPPENNLLTEEKIERFKLLLKLKEDPSISELILKQNLNEFKKKPSYSLVEKHNEKWGYLNFKDGKKFQTIQETIEVLAEDWSENDDKLNDYIQKINQQSLDLKEKQIKLEKELPDDVVWLGNVVRLMQEKKFALRIILNKTFFGDDSIFSTIFREISKHYFIAMNQLEFLTVDEIVKLTDSDEISLEAIIERQDCFVCIKDKDVYKLITGNEAQEIVKKVKPVIKEGLKIIKGNIANFGIAQGKAKLIRLTTKVQIIQNEISKMEKGQILVTETTGPELILAVKKASAIVTNEGGINSHAAIVSRELNIPCVIGTKIATEVIKDGDIIEVDANKGEIKLNGGTNE